MIGIVACAWLTLGTWCAPAVADGGALRLSGTAGGYRISVFTAPTPFRAGPVDVSVLVQDASTGNPATQVPVTIRMTRSGGLALEYPATTAAATNKLFRAAQFELAWPAPVIVLFSVHQILVRRRTDRVDRGEAPEQAR
jgi:hypothetical protein